MKRHMKSAAALILVTASCVWAQADDGDALKGPTVSPETVRTLVHHDMSGRLAILEERPEIAAVRLLTLDEDTRAEADAVIESHAARMRDLLIDNLDLLKQSGDALREGDNEKASRAGLALYDAFDPEHPRDPVLGPLEAVLTAEQSAEVRRLVDEYWEARIGAEFRGMAGADESERARVEQRLIREMFQREIQTTYQYAIQPYQQRIEFISESVGATEDERLAIRDIIVEYMKTTRLTPTPEQRLDAIREIYLVLGDDAKLKLFELVARQAIDLQGN